MIILIVVRENALFALDLFANCNELTPIIFNFSRCKTFGSAFCPHSIRSKDDMESENEKKNFQLSVFMIGRKWKSSEDNLSLSSGSPKHNSNNAFCELDRFLSYNGCESYINESRGHLKGDEKFGM